MSRGRGLDSLAQAGQQREMGQWPAHQAVASRQAKWGEAGSDEFLFFLILKKLFICANSSL